MNKTYNSIAIGVLTIIAALMAASAPQALGEQPAADCQSIVNNANSIIVVWDKQEKITYMNPFGQKFFGFDKGELIGNSILGTFLTKTDEHDAMLKDILANPGKNTIVWGENVKKDGQKVKVLWSNSGIRDASGNIVRIVAIGNVVEKNP